MKKIFLTMLTVSASVLAYAAGQQASISTVPSPAVSTKPLEVKIQTGDLGGEVFCYTWCADINGSEKSPFSWDDANSDKFKMSGSGGTYTIKISDLKSFYSLTDSELEGLTKLGFIAKTRDGRQTDDLFVNVEQGRRDAYAGGEGTAADPYILKTSAHLLEFAKTSSDWASDVYVRLDADIDGITLLSSIGSAGNPYKGHFDGNGHTIDGVNLTSTTIGAPVGLFAVIEGAEISDLGVTDSYIIGMNNAGILVGKAISGKISRCYTTGTVNGKSICIGGLVGENVAATITDCYSGANVTNSDDYATGGFVGKNGGTISNVYATGLVAGKDYVGGIAGANYGVIKNSVAINGKVTSANTFSARFGGNGNSENQSVSNHSWEEMPSSAAWSEHGDHATKKSANDLVSFANFAALTGWDFNNVWEWKQEGNKEYPVLRNVSGQKNVIPDVFYQSTAVEEIFNDNAASIKVGPNPFNGYLNVTAGTPLRRVDVYAINGSVVASVDCNNATEVTVETAAATPGVYIVRVMAENGSNSTFKLIKR